MSLESLERAGRKVLGMQNHTYSKWHRLREHSRYFRYRLRTPPWILHPLNLQLDTHNYCNLWMGEGTGCAHCNVKPMKRPCEKGLDWNLPRGRMPSKMIRYLIEYWSKRGVNTVSTWVNGEPLMDERLPWICDLAAEHGLRTLIDTNATLYDKRKNLVHSNLSEVRMTISAVTPETYLQVHGRDLFREADATLRWFLKNHLPTQYPRIYFVTDAYNVHELFTYVKRWIGKVHITLFPLHEIPDVQMASTAHKPEDASYWDDITKKLTGKYPKQRNRPIDIYPDGNRRVRYFSHYIICQGTGTFAVSWNGLILHCTDVPYKYNYGHVYDDPDLLKVWRRKVASKVGHPVCAQCTARRDDYDQSLKRMLSKVGVENFGEYNGGDAS